ncbi:MAG: hypothetical protein R6V07_08775 [Armatimonadota bacterium]
MAQINKPRHSHGPANLRLSARQWLLIAGFGVVIALGCRDMHLNADSLHYIDMARTLIEDHQVATWHLTLTAEHVPRVESLWPPMYPILLAGPMLLGLSGEGAAWLIAVVSLVATLALLTAVCRRIEWALLLGLAFIFMTFNQGIAFRAFSETPFMALSFGALVAMALALQGPSANYRRARVLWLAILAGVLVAAAALTRHIGIVLIPALGLVCLFGPVSHGANRLKLRATAVVGLAIGVGLPLGLWLTRQWMLGVSFFGPERPPSRFTVMELLRRAGQGISADAAVMLLLIAAALLGYHLLQRDEAAGWRPFAVALAAGAVLFALLHEAGTIASHAMVRMDNPPEARQFFPGYAALLVATAALLSLARPPDGVLRRRWPILAVVGLPIVFGPLVAGSLAHDLTPERTRVDEWVALSTASDDLVIGWRAWNVRYHTGRPVLQSGMVTEPSVYRGPAVADFLERFGHHFGGAWLVVSPDTTGVDGVRASYEEAGLELEQVAELDVAGVYHYQDARLMRIYRVTGWR